jgi:hypothetical protein
MMCSVWEAYWEGGSEVLMPWVSVLPRRVMEGKVGRKQHVSEDRDTTSGFWLGVDQQKPAQILMKEGNITG